MPATATKASKAKFIGKRFVTSDRGMTFAYAVDSFIRSRKLGTARAKGPCADRTAEEYRYDLRFFTDFMTTTKGFANYNEMGKADVDDFVLHIRDRKKANGSAWSENSKNKVYRSVRAFLNWVKVDSECKTAGLEPHLGSIPSIPKAQRRVWVPTKELVLDFLDSFDEGFFWGLRDKLIASVLIECGPRNGELCNLRVQDVISTGHIRLNSKEKEERLAPIDQDVVTLVRRYIGHRANVAAPGVDHLFVSRTGVPMHPQAMDKVFGRRRAEGYGKIERNNITPHVLRHFFATQYIVRGGSIEALKEILGHSTLDMVNVYLHLANELKFVKDDHAKVSPLRSLLEERSKTPKRRAKLKL